jgi:hypothetical protein
VGQLGKIFNVLGTPITSVPAAGGDKTNPSPSQNLSANPDRKESTALKSVAAVDRNRVWLDADLLPAFVAFEDCGPLDMSAIFRVGSSSSGVGGGGAGVVGDKAELALQSSNLALLERMLVLSPNRRITAAQVLLFLFHVFPQTPLSPSFISLHIVFISCLSPVCLSVCLPHVHSLCLYLSIVSPP